MTELELTRDAATCAPQTAVQELAKSLVCFSEERNLTHDKIRCIRAMRQKAKSDMQKNRKALVATASVHSRASCAGKQGRVLAGATDPRVFGEAKQSGTRPVSTHRPGDLLLMLLPCQSFLPARVTVRLGFALDRPSLVTSQPSIVTDAISIPLPTRTALYKWNATFWIAGRS
jgi:hypothetical protein